MNRGNTLVFTLLGLAVAAIVGLCFAPLTLRRCGHPGSLFNRWLPQWDHHDCAGLEAGADLWDIYDLVETCRKEHGHVKDSLFDMVPWRSHRDPRYEFVYTHKGDDWQVSVAKTVDLPGWYLMTSDGDGKVHFNKTGPATTQDILLPESWP